MNTRELTRSPGKNSTCSLEGADVLWWPLGIVAARGVGSRSDWDSKYSSISTFSRSCWFSKLNLDVNDAGVQSL